MIPLLHLISHEETHSDVMFEHKPLQNALAPKQVRAVWGDGGEDPVIIRKAPEMTQSVATSGGETVILFGQLTERSEETGTGDVTSGKREMPPDRDTCTGQPCTGVNKTMILDRPEVVVVVSDDKESEEKGVPKQTEELGGPGSDQNKQESCNTKKQGDESLTCEGEREPPSEPSAEVIQSQHGDPQDEVRKAWSGEDITPSVPRDSDPHEETSKDKAMHSSDPTSVEEKGRTCMNKSNISHSNEPASTASKALSATPPTALPPCDAPQPDKENVEKETGIRKEKGEELEKIATKDNQPEPEQQITPPPHPQDKGGVAADRIFQLLQDQKSKEELLLHEKVACK